MFLFTLSKYPEAELLDHLVVLFFCVCLFIFERERETGREKEHSRGGAEREGDRDSEAGSRLQAVSTEPDEGLEPTNQEIMT